MADFYTFGEVMLRLKAPGHERFFQSPSLESTFGGGEANVAVGLSRLGLKVSFISAVPSNMIGEACLEEIRKHGVDTSGVLRQGNRLGIYFLEAGANQRPLLLSMTEHILQYMKLVQQIIILKVYLKAENGFTYQE